jgi:phosphatidylinositol glycan class B
MEHVSMITESGSRSAQHWRNHEPARKAVGRKAWPHELVFFEQLEPVLKEVLKGTRYRECWRGFNSHVHDDWRRVGDVIVWCLE